MVTWEQVKTFDDTVLDEEKAIINGLEQETDIRCPSLAKEGECFYYCTKDIQNLEKAKKQQIGPDNEIYQKHVSVQELSLYCMNTPETCHLNREIRLTNKPVFIKKNIASFSQYLAEQEQQERRNNPLG